MLTAEDNTLLTQVGPGTAGGDLLRRYWYPIGLPCDLSEAAPTKFVRILGEDLVLFRDRRGMVGLIGDHCPHRGASLRYGRVEERGIACAYHGWLYDTQGNCLETPAEPADSLLHLTVRQRAYPVQERYGLYWAYLGPPPAPLLQRYDAAESGPIKAIGHVPRLDCNWLQIVENNLDQSHVLILHQTTGGGNNAGRGSPVTNTTRGRIDELERIEYNEAPFGIQRRQVHKNGYDETDLIVFPSTQRIYNRFAVKVPIDDTHTYAYSVVLDLSVDRERDSYHASADVHRDEQNTNIEYYVETIGKTPSDAMHPYATYRMDELRLQDFTVLETQGPIWAREHEHLATADSGVVLLREVLKREIEKVQRGEDPIGVIRDPEQGPIDTFIGSHFEMARRFPTFTGTGP